MRIPRPDYRPTERELVVIRALVEHGTMVRAAQALCVSSYTIDAHVDRLRQRSGLHYLVQIIAWAAEEGWLAERGNQE
jgi:DNA-binding NarL/FixJ family response regulator